MAIIHLEGKVYDDVVKNGIVLVDFYADWCGPCKMLAPMLEALSNKRVDIKVLKINVDEEEELAQKFGILTIPTLYLYKNGQLVSKKQGFQTLEMLMQWIDSIN